MRAPVRSRVRSVDALRGLVVALMIVVNTLGDVPGVPAFTQHLPESVDGYSLADMILPWFLFLVGVSLPLALGHFLVARRRLTAFSRITPRVAGLLLLGLVFVNAERIAADAVGLSGDDWLLLTTSALMIVLITRAPAPDAAFPATGRRATLARGVKIVAAIAFIVLLAIYRGRDPGQTQVTWLRPSWWGILGIIGWTYLVGAVAYLATGGRRIALGALLGVALANPPATADRMSGLLAFLRLPIGVHEFLGSYACLVLAGAIAGTILVERDDSRSPQRARLRTGGLLAGLGVALWLLGSLLRPLHGYHKLGSSESWALVGAGQAALMLALFHVALDRAQARPPHVLQPTQWLADAGSNALLAYLLSELQAPLCDHIDIDVIGPDAGTRAVVNAILMTVLFIALAAAATRARVRLRL
jgi:heparan-alpha-glucosaminide N-acetyltransferase